MSCYDDVLLKKDIIDDYDPFEISGITKVLDIIDNLMQKDENILICAPSNLDGVLSTSIFLLTLRYLKLRVNYYIFDDSEDINIEDLKNHIELMKSKSVFIFDRILDVELPVVSVNISNKNSDICTLSNSILINPNQDSCVYSFKELTLPSLTYKIIQAISKFYNLKSIIKFIDIVFISLFNDNVKVYGENFELLRDGAHFLKNTKNYGLRELIELNDENISINNLISFLDPKFVSKSKITNSRLVVELLTVSNSLKANQISKYLIKQVNGKMEEGLWT